MFKKFVRLLLIGALVISLATPLLVTEGSASRVPFIGTFSFEPGSIDFDALLRRLGNILNNETELYVGLNNFIVEVACLNPSKWRNSKNASTSSQAFFPDESVSTTIPVSPTIVHNGTAEVSYPFGATELADLTSKVCYLAAQGDLCPNDQWEFQYTDPCSDDDYDIVGFDARLELREYGTALHTILATCYLNNSGTTYVCDVTCDSQAGQDCSE